MVMTVAAYKEGQSKTSQTRVQGREGKTMVLEEVLR